MSSSPSSASAAYRSSRTDGHHPVPALARRLGWDDHWQSVLDDVIGPASHDDSAVPTLGRVCRVDRGAAEILLPHPDPRGTSGAGGTPTRYAGDHTARTVTARWSASLTRAAAADPGATPAAGDWALLQPATDVSGASWSLTRILPRRSQVLRLEVSGTSHSQVLAANADVVAVVQAMVPDLDLGRVERLLALAWSSGARPVVLLTKADLHPDPGAAVSEVMASAAGCEVLAVAALEGSGLEPVREWLARGETVALLGASGVGKSTLLNALLGSAVMATRELGVEGKGRHTTVTRELHLAPGGGAVLDTPGLRSIGLRGAEAVDAVFPEIEALAAECRFADCSHDVEPGCAVLAAVESGDLPGRRVDSYRAFERESAFQARRSDARLQAEYGREIRTRARSRRRHVNRQ